MKLTTEKVKTIVSTMKDSLRIEISESNKKDITTLIKEKKTMLSTTLSESIKEATEVIEVGMEKEKSAASNALDDQIAAVTERLNVVASDSTASEVAEITMRL